METKYQETLKKVIRQPYPLSSKLVELIMGECHIEKFSRKQKITESGQDDRWEYFLLDGIIHRFTLVEDGEFITTGFYFGPTILMPNFARTSEGKSIFSLQALTNVTIAKIPVTSLEKLQDSHEEIRRWMRKVIERKLKRNFADEIRFRTSNARERLMYLRHEFPNLENLVPHTCIASYVGITPVSFSRLRKEMSHSS